MSQNILGSFNNEYVVNIQNVKLQYLQKENQVLLEDIHDLEKALKMNKQAMKLFIEQS